MLLLKFQQEDDKYGTRWKVCWIPLGGYVKFFGDRNVFSQADHEKILKQYNKDCLLYTSPSPRD